MGKEKNVQRVIVNSMTYEDVSKFLIDDYLATEQRLHNKFHALLKQLIRKVKNVREYPYNTESFRSKSANGLEYIVMGVVSDDKIRKKGGFPYIVTKFSYKGMTHFALIVGTFPMEPVSDGPIHITVYHPHVIQRYFERVHDEYAEIDMENFMDFFMESGGLLQLMVTPSVNYDHHKKGETTHQYVRNGMLIGNDYPIGNTWVNVFLTFVSEDMLKDNQAVAHQKLNEICDGRLRFLTDYGRNKIDDFDVAEFIDVSESNNSYEKICGKTGRPV